MNGSRLRIALLGARGRLGSAVFHELTPRHDLVAFDRVGLDITDADALLLAMQQVRPDAIVNCAAYNAVDAAEDDPVTALQVNALAVHALARTADAAHAALIHYGSDFVFDGLADRPYTETDRPNPRSVYGASKMLGEWFALETSRGYVLRVESLFGRAPGSPPAKGSLETIVSDLREGRTAKVFEDRTVSPTSIADAARATREILERNPPPGLYHCVNSGHATWAEVGLEIARLLGVEPRLERVRLADVSFRAQRPRYCALANDKLIATSISMPSWQDALATYVRG